MLYNTLYNETCLNDHLYQATTYLHRPVPGVPAAPHSKLCSETLPKATICLMRTTDYDHFLHPL